MKNKVGRIEKKRIFVVHHAIRRRHAVAIGRQNKRASGPIPMLREKSEAEPGPPFVDENLRASWPHRRLHPLRTPRKNIVAFTVPSSALMLYVAAPSRCS